MEEDEVVVSFGSRILGAGTGAWALGTGVADGGA